MIKVTDDLFGIARRLLHINPKYVVFWNNKTERYEVHTDRLEFIVPYDHLDGRTLEYAEKTLVRNADIIDKEITAHNDNIVKDGEKLLADADVEFEEYMRIAYRAGRAVTLGKNTMKEF